MMEEIDLASFNPAEKRISSSYVEKTDIRAGAPNFSGKLIREKEEDGDDAGDVNEEEEDHEEEEEELAVLPRHTKVIVTGNNRTKSVLVGLHGVVKKAVGLGGWHWLVLTNGLEVKLQRNALSVLEPPTGFEDDDDGSDHHSSRCNSEDLGKSFRHKVRLPKPCVPSRGGSRNQLKEKIDFNKLEMESLHRYWRHFHLCELGPNPSKEQLVNAVARHFMSQRLDETQVITNFMQAAKRLKTVCG